MVPTTTVIVCLSAFFLIAFWFLHAAIGNLGYFKNEICIYFSLGFRPFTAPLENGYVLKFSFHSVTYRIYCKMNDNKHALIKRFGRELLSSPSCTLFHCVIAHSWVCLISLDLGGIFSVLFLFLSFIFLDPHPAKSTCVC